MEIIRTVVNSDLKNIKKIRDDFIDLLEDRSYQEDIIFRFKLILDELMANSYKHGNQKDVKKKIVVNAMVSDRFLYLKVTDEGKGIARESSCDRFAENGRGIALVEKLSDQMIIDKNTIACLILNRI